MKSGKLLLIAALLLAGGAALWFLTGDQTASREFQDKPRSGAAGKSVKIIPRNEKPMDEYTQYYQRKTMDVTTGGQTKSYPYFFYKPQPPYPEGVKFPLVLILHGGTGKAYAGKYLISGGNAETYPAFVVVPVMAQSRIWSFPEDGIEGYNAKGPVRDTRYHEIDEAVFIVKQMMEAYPVDPSRVYVLGCSDGGFGTFGALRHYPDLFAAGVPMSGGWRYEDASQMLETPMWIFHGAKDDVVSVKYSRDMAGAIKYLKGRAYYTEYKNMGHNCPSSRLYQNNVWEWLFKQQKAG